MKRWLEKDADIYIDVDIEVDAPFLVLKIKIVLFWYSSIHAIEVNHKTGVVSFRLKLTLRVMTLAMTIISLSTIKSTRHG